jgi:hypothetical protein
MERGVRERERRSGEGQTMDCWIKVWQNHPSIVVGVFNNISLFSYRLDRVCNLNSIEYKL